MIHKDTAVSWDQFRGTSREGANVAVQVSDTSRSEKQIVENRYYVKSIVEVLLLCAHQDIAIRGHDEKANSANPGNFKRIFDMLVSRDKRLQCRVATIPANATYQSPEMQNELLGVMADIVRDKIRKDIHASGYFALMVDETKDVSKQEQLSVVLRYVVEGAIYERFLTFSEVDDLTARGLVNIISDTLGKMGIPIDSCVCQNYDGASVMSGHLRGVQALFRELNSKAIYFHCCSHRLNLVLVDAVKRVPKARAFFTLLESLYLFMTNSAVLGVFKSKKIEAGVDGRVAPLKRLSDTRWSCRFDTVKGILVTLMPIISTLEDISRDTHAKRAAEAAGLLVGVKSFQFILFLEMFFKVLSITNILSKQLQEQQLDLAAAARLVSAVMNTLSLARGDDEWQKIWAAAVDKAATMNIEVELPSSVRGRKRQRPTSLDDYMQLDDAVDIFDGRDRMRPDNPETYYRIESYCPIFDAVCSEMDRRFSSTNRKLMEGINACSPLAANFLSYQALKIIAMQYDLDCSSLEVEARVARDYLLSEEQNNTSETASIGDVVRALGRISSAVPVLLKVLNIFLTFGVGSVGCERSLSPLSRIKTKLRSTMSEERLSNLTLLSIEKDLSSSLDLDMIVDTFAGIDKGRRLRLK